MSYQSVIRQKPPGLLVLLCLSLWCGVLFDFTDELLTQNMTRHIARSMPGLVPWFWAGLTTVAAAQVLIIWCLLRGHHWARVASFMLVGLAALAFVPYLPVILSLLLNFFQMPFRGWPDILLTFIGQTGFITHSNISFWETLAVGIRIAHMVGTIVCLLLPNVVKYCLPLPPPQGPPRRELRPLY
ncbi:MAG: hypothetical protein ACR2OZ_14830 [Verrucomicrobiales bacterium]